MVDEYQVNDVLVYRDSAGFYRERPIEAGASGAVSAPASYTAPKGYQQINSVQLASAQAMTVPAGTMRAVVQNNGAQATRWRNDGSNPTATVGQRLIGGDQIDITGDLSAYRFIREAEGVQLDINYYG